MHTSAKFSDQILHIDVVPLQTLVANIELVQGMASTTLDTTTVSCTPFVLE
jgi:hypothetical protein